MYLVHLSGKYCQAVEHPSKREYANHSHKMVPSDGKSNLYDCDNLSAPHGKNAFFVFKRMRKNNHRCTTHELAKIHEKILQL